MGMKAVKVGSQIEIYYDGKLGRAVVATVIAKNKLHKIKVRFVPWASDDGLEVEGWLHRNKRGFKGKCFGQRYDYRGYIRMEGSLMNMLFGAPGDYYATLCKPPQAYLLEPTEKNEAEQVCLKLKNVLLSANI